MKKGGTAVAAAGGITSLIHRDGTLTAVLPVDNTEWREGRRRHVCGICCTHLELLRLQPKQREKQ